MRNNLVRPHSVNPHALCVFDFDSKIAESGYSQVKELPNNFNTVLRKIRSLRKRLQKDPNLCQNYKDTMQNYIKWMCKKVF